MMYDPGELRAALAAAVGEDATLMAELRGAFLDGARAHADALARSAGGAEWRVAAMKLQGLAASFGAVDLMLLAEAAAAGPAADVASLRAIDAAIDGFAG